MPNISQQKYQGQFGEYTITEEDRQGVIVYRGSLLAAAICFGMGTAVSILPNPTALNLLTWLYTGFCVALGIALIQIHIYFKLLHQTLQIFWGIGSVVSLGLTAIASQNNQSLVVYIYENPLSILGIGFTFAALTGIYFKEAFCFNRLETKFLVAIAPALLIGHLLGFLSMEVERYLLIAWAVLFLVFAIRKLFQDIPSDIGDKSVFDYLAGTENGTPS